MNNIFDEIISAAPRKIIFSKLKSKNGLYNKIVISAKGNGYQAEKFTDKQAFHENIPADKLKEYCIALAGKEYLRCNAFSENTEFILMVSSKGKVTLKKQQTKSAPKLNTEHNRKKKYIIDAASAAAPLVDMGIFTADGKVVNSMYDKYRQINRFIEIIDDEAAKIKKDELNIIDFGCGKSYLTFVLYYYFTEVLHKKVNITGLDLKAEVIKKCNAAAEKYGYRGLKFELGDINGYKADRDIDMVITLHACDTATDYALYNAIEWGAKYIFSVPCCQHELNSQISSDDYSILTRYGILKERFSAIATDAIRANALEMSGYKTQVLEFIDMEHTPKNLLIRAVKTNVSEAARKKAKEEINRLTDEFSLEPTLIKLLEKERVL
jgi:SAM-dependent methyltransferase